MTIFPPLTHVALTVRDLSVSAPWYRALFDAEPVLDEDTEPAFHHTVYLLGNGTLFGLHQHQQPAPVEAFSEYRVGLDHVAFGVEDRDALEK
jgi:glyoxylase I family protein